MNVGKIERDSVFDGILKWLAVSLFILVPVAYTHITYYPVKIKDLLVGIVVALMTIKSLVKGSHSGAVKPSISIVEVSLLLFFLLNVISLLMNPTEYRARPYILELGALILVFYIYASTAEKISFSVLLRVNTCAVFVVLGVGLWQVLQGMSKPISTLGNPNYYGGYLVALWPLLIVSFKDKSYVFKALAFVNLALFLVNTVFIKSWAMLLSLGLSVFLLIFLYGEDKRRRWVFLFIYGVFLIVLSQIPVLRDSLLKQVTQDVRPYIWGSTVDMIKDRPFFGCGAGKFLIFYPIYRDPQYFTHPLSVDNTDHAHCEILELFAETGMIGLISFLMFLLFLLRQVMKVARKGDRLFQLQVYSILAGAFLLMFENLFDVNLRYMSSKFIFWSFLGWAYGMVSRLRHGSPLSAHPALPRVEASRKVLHPVLRVLGVLLVIFAFIDGFVRPFLGDFYFKKGIRERNDGDYEMAIDHYKKAVRIFPEHIEAQYRLGFLYGSLGDHEKALTAYQGVMRIAPFFASVHGNIGTIYSRMGNFKRAYQHLLIQVKLNPYDPDRLCSLASVLLQMGRLEEAKKTLRRALQFNPDHGFARQTLQRLGKES